MNYCNFIVKIVEKPVQQYFKDNISLVEIGVQISQLRSAKTLQTLQIILWGDLGYDSLKYYQINDYIIIEGYISLWKDFLQSDKFRSKSQVLISVRKIYPLNFR